MWEWFGKHLEIIVTSLVSLAGGAITAAGFVLRMKSGIEHINIRTIRIESEVLELKRFKDDFLIAKTKLEDYENDMEDVKESIRNGKQELALEFTKTINNVIDMMHTYIKRNDDEVNRLRDRYHELSDRMHGTLLQILAEVRK